MGTVNLIPAPVIVFCYNRPDHLQKTIESVRKNSLAAETKLYVFSDGSKGPADTRQVNEVRTFINQISGFGGVEIFKSQENKGLSKSVIEGVTQILQVHQKVIVLEDDMVVTPDFLTFMNIALDSYQMRKDVFSVTGYAPPLRLPAGYQKDLYLAPRSSSWGWGTWSDRWGLAEWNPEKFSKLLKMPGVRERLVRGGTDLWPMLLKQQKGIIDSWAVRWCFIQSLHDGYGVYPVSSKLQNIGTDGTGTNFNFDTQKYDVALNHADVQIDPLLKPDPEVIAAFRRFYNLPFYLRIKNLLKYGIW